MQARGWAGALAGALVLTLALAAAGCGGESEDGGSGGVPRAAERSRSAQFIRTKWRGAEDMGRG